MQTLSMERFPRWLGNPEVRPQDVVSVESDEFMSAESIINGALCAKNVAIQLLLLL